MIRLYSFLFFFFANDKGLPPFPAAGPGDPVPQKLYQFSGRGAVSYDSIDRIHDFTEWKAAVSARKEAVQRERTAYLNTRYDWSAVRTDNSFVMSRGKRIPIGPVTLLPKGVASWDELSSMSAEEIRKRDLLPEGFKPLSHPAFDGAHAVSDGLDR